MGQGKNEKILVAGAGAIGSLFGARLGQAGYDITLVDGWEEHIRKIGQEGLEVSAPQGDANVRVKAVHPQDFIHSETGPDIILLAVKSYDTPAMLNTVKPLLVTDHTLVVSCQNGVNEDLIAATAGRKFTLGCVISFGAVLEGPGSVRQLNSEGLLIIGRYDGGTDRIEEVKRIFSAITHTEATNNLMGHRWSKLALNCMGNPLLTLSGYTAAELHQEPRARKVMTRLVAELVRAGEAWGVVLEPIAGVNSTLWKKAVHTSVSDVEHVLDVLGRKLGDRRSSMVQDLNSGRPTEIEFLNGYVVRKAAEKGLDAPCNKSVVALVQKLSRGEIRPDPGHLDLLRDCSAT